MELILEIRKLCFKLSKLLFLKNKKENIYQTCDLHLHSFLALRCFSLSNHPDLEYHHIVEKEQLYEHNPCLPNLRAAVLFVSCDLKRGVKAHIM